MITLNDIRKRISENVAVLKMVKSAIGATTMSEVYQSVEMNWSSFSHALKKGKTLTETRRGRERTGKYTGVEALKVLSVSMRKKTNEEYAILLEKVAADLRRMS